MRVCCGRDDCTRAQTSTLRVCRCTVSSVRTLVVCSVMPRCSGSCRFHIHSLKWPLLRMPNMCLNQCVSLHYRYSDLKSGTNHGDNPSDASVFKQLATLAIGSDGTVKVTVHQEEVLTLTTLTTGSKGVARSPSSPGAPFPLPYMQSFDVEAVHSPPKYWYDQMGAWEVAHAARGHGISVDDDNQVMRQVVPVWPACWGYSCSGPTTYFGQ